MSAPTNRARNWQQKIASMRADRGARWGRRSVRFGQVVAAFQVGLGPVGGEHLLGGDLPVVGDQREAAVAGGVVGDLVVSGGPGDGVPGAGGAPVAGVGAGPAPLLAGRPSARTRPPTRSGSTPAVTDTVGGPWNGRKVTAGGRLAPPHGVVRVGGSAVHGPNLRGVAVYLCVPGEGRPGFIDLTGLRQGRRSPGLGVLDEPIISVLPAA